MDEIIIALGIVCAPVLSIYLVLRYKARRLQILQELARSNTPLTPQLVDLFRRPTRQSSMLDYRRGIFWLAVGIAVAIILGLGAFDIRPRLTLMASLPILVGIGYFITGRFFSENDTTAERDD